MTKPSIVFFVSHAAGGIRELWSDLAAGFAERGHAVELAGLYPHGPDDVADEQRWTYMLPNRPGGLLAKFAMLRNLAGWLRRTRPDVIITAMPAANVLLPIFAKLFNPRTRLIVTHHSPVGTHNRLLDAMDGLTGRLPNVCAIVGVSDAVTQSLAGKAQAYRAKSLTIHNALPRRVDDMLARLAPRGPRQALGRTVIAAGRLAEQKNYPMLINAAPAMPDVRVEILGSGPDEAALRKLIARHGVANHVHLLGHCDRASALARVSKADIFVQVSLFEGHSLALLEAATLGLPLIVSNVPSQVEGITARDGSACGLVIDLGDTDGLAHAITMVLDDPQHYALWSSRALILAQEAKFDTMMARYDSLATCIPAKSN
ncbi:glycosyltransferase [Sphingobium sp.]|uniref:glycosyltransferase n=1 Tax=Sphingobium sp. TaxID=1912891 RepID=UPI003BB4E200